jgi:uncharacterized protein YggE
MPSTFTLAPSYRALAIGGAAAALLIGAFALGTSRGSAAAAGSTAAAAQRSASAEQRPAGARAGAVLTSAPGPARITVTGTGTVSGTPDQLVLSMGVQVNAASVGAALREANQAVRQVTAALRARGVRAADIMTSGLSIQPSYRSSSQVPDGYAASESLNATLRRLAAAGGQIDAGVRAGGNATTVDGISLNLTDTSSLLARARAAAVADARVKAAQYARALGQPLGPVVSVTDQGSSQPFPFGTAAGSAASRAAVPISPGSQQLSVSITVVYALA